MKSESRCPFFSSFPLSCECCNMSLQLGGEEKWVCPFVLIAIRIIAIDDRIRDIGGHNDSVSDPSA